MISNVTLTFADGRTVECVLEVATYQLALPADLAKFGEPVGLTLQSKARFVRLAPNSSVNPMVTVQDLGPDMPGQGHA